MGIKKCVNCHKSIFYQTESNWCGCESVKVWVSSHGESEKDAIEKYSSDSESLAQEVAEDLYNNDPTDPNHFEAIVCIKGIQGGIETFKVTAEVNVDFSATELHAITR